MSMRRTPASSVSPACMGAPARALTASAPQASLAHTANKVSMPCFLSPPSGVLGLDKFPRRSEPTNWTLPSPQALDMA